ncbi:MAG: toxin-antitoxin system HicB family antitoxin [Mailhella sp.]|nr:toxin-antitoxin system HicB family antitoxin [Mailhella sp.]
MQGQSALRLDPDTYRRASIAAAVRGVSLNSFFSDAVLQAVANEGIRRARRGGHGV